MTNYWKYSIYSKINPKVKENFPFANPREHQLETISEIVEAIDKGYKYIILEAGTGTGKSAIAATLASMYDSTYILTVTKQLQDQYLNDFHSLGFKLVKGRGNFECRKYAEENISQNCDIGRCIVEGYKCEYSIKNNYDDLSEDKVCAYDCQKFKGLTSKVVISNYHYLYLELNHVGDFTKRNLMIFDEAHNVESSIMHQLKLEFNRKELKEYIGVNLSKETIEKLDNGNYSDWIEFINKIKGKYAKEYDKIKGIKRDEVNQKRKYLKQRIEDCSIFISNIKEDPDKWIFDYDSYHGIGEFKPVKVDKYAHETFFDYGDVCIFMSATILDYKLFSEWLGINPYEVYAIRRKSPFAINRNPIKTFDEFDMSYKNLSNSAPKTINVINRILDNHKNEKGLIHTVSYNCKNFLTDNISSNRLIDHKTYNRARQLRKFKNSKKPLVLISPSMNEGVDLPGDLCRFQIIYKIPYPNTQDKQTKKRMKMDNRWYKYQTALSLVQTVGRGMRYEDDYCMTYFIDNRLNDFILKDQLSNNFLPDTFIEAINIDPAKIDKTKVKKYKTESIIDSVKTCAEIITRTSKKSNTLYSTEYFRNLAKGISKKDGFISDRELSKNTDDDFVYIGTGDIKLNQKADLKNKGKELEKDDKLEAIKFYDELKTNDLFNNDYYPYRRQCILFKNKIKDDLKDWNTIKEIFENEIYLNAHQYVWLHNKVLELIDKLDFADNEVNEMEKLIENFEQNHQKFQKPTFPIAEKIFKDEDGQVKVLSDEKYDLLQDLYFVKELGVGYIRRKDFEKAIPYYLNLLEEDFLYYQYHAYKQLARIYKEMDNHEMFTKIYESY